MQTLSCFFFAYYTGNNIRNNNKRLIRCYRLKLSEQNQNKNFCSIRMFLCK